MRESLPGHNAQGRHEKLKWMATRISAELAALIESKWPDILAGIAAGDLVRDVLRAAGIKYSHVRAYIQGDAAKRLEWDDAREESADAFLDEVLAVARARSELALNDAGEPILGKYGKALVVAVDSALARTQVDELKWAARIRNPRAYSDKAQLDVNVRTIDLTRIISEANARLAAAREPRILEHEPPAALPAPEELAGAAIVEKASKLLELL